MFFKRCILPEEYKTLQNNVNRYLNDRNIFIKKKHDRSTTAGVLIGKRIGLLDDLWVKRFNYTSFAKYVFKLVLGSRAIRLYNISLKLHNMRLPIPEPLGYIELSVKERNSFFFSKVLESAKTLSELYRERRLLDDSSIVEELAYTLSNWHLRGVVHADLKWPNILLVFKDGVYKFYFVDLDQVRVYPRFTLKGVKEDLVRFYRFSLEINAMEWVEREFFKTYMKFIPEDFRSQIDIEYIKDCAFKEWQIKGSKRYL
jgi:hypothetical protein